jgi:histone H3/H4
MMHKYYKYRKNRIIRGISMERYYIVKSNLRKLAKGFAIGKGFDESLNIYVKEAVLKACLRAKANGRKTVMPKDL